jgi:hypothetical protein
MIIIPLLFHFRSKLHIVRILHLKEEDMYSRIVFVFCTIAIFLFLASSSSVAVAEENNFNRARKLSNAQWLAAPHFQALAKRGRFVFRDAPNDYLHDTANDDLGSLTDKRNWRL